VELRSDFGERTINQRCLMFRIQINLEPGFQRQSVWTLRDRKSEFHDHGLHSRPRVGSEHQRNVGTKKKTRDYFAAQCYALRSPVRAAPKSVKETHQKM